jgi:hypothetical protein
VPHPWLTDTFDPDPSVHIFFDFSRPPGVITVTLAVIFPKIFHQLADLIRLESSRSTSLARRKLDFGTTLSSNTLESSCHSENFVGSFHEFF